MASWTAQATYPAPIGELDTTVCIGAGACVAIGSIDNGPIESSSVVATTSNDGRIWKSAPLPTAMSLSGLSCPSNALCIAVGGHVGGGGSPIHPNQLGTVIVSTNEGRSWTAQPLPKGTGYLNDVSCASDSFCLAVGDKPDGSAAAIATTNEGVTWSTVAPPDESGLSLVTCPAPGTCLAVGDRALRTIDGGQVWTDEGFSEGEGLACPTLTNCVLVGGTVAQHANPMPLIETSDDAGVTWTGLVPSSPNASGALRAVTCGSPTFCMAVGGGVGPQGGPGPGLIFVTIDGGSTWDLRSSPAGMGGIGGVSCVGPSDCVVNGTDPTGVSSLSAVTANGGYSWTTSSVAVGVGGIQAISCPSVLDCVAVGSDADTAYALRTTDGGRSWRAQSLTTAVVSLFAVSCGSHLDCVAVGHGMPEAELQGFQGAAVTTSDGGASWRLISLPSDIGSLTAVSCATAMRCLALGEAPPTTSPNGPVPGGTYEAIAISTRNGGNTWSPPVSIPATNFVQGISCSTTSFYVAVGQQFSFNPPGAAIPVAEVTRNGGKAWVGHMLPGGGEQPIAISCASASRCVAVGAINAQLTDDGLFFLEPAGPVVPGALMVSSDGGAHWSFSTKLRVGNLDGVSCPSSTFCALVGSNRSGTGPVLLSGDPGQSPLSITNPINGPGSFLEVSCRTTRACEVVGQSTSGGGLIVQARTIAR